MKSLVRIACTGFFDVLMSAMTSRMSSSDPNCSGSEPISSITPATLSSFFTLSATSRSSCNESGPPPAPDEIRANGLFEGPSGTAPSRRSDTTVPFEICGAFADSIAQKISGTPTKTPAMTRSAMIHAGERRRRGGGLTAIVRRMLVLPVPSSQSGAVRS